MKSLRLNYLEIRLRRVSSIGCSPGEMSVIISKVEADSPLLTLANKISVTNVIITIAEIFSRLFVNIVKRDVIESPEFRK